MFACLPVHIFLRNCLSLGLGLLAAQAAHATITTVSDMLAAEWTRRVDSTEGTFSYTASIPPVGGNLGSFWQFGITTGNNMPPGQNTGQREVFLLNAATYDPIQSGALGSVTIGFDTNNFRSNFANHFGGLASAALQQSNRSYSARLNSQEILGDGWRSFDFTSTSASDWLEFGTNSTPDFSANGAPITFGFRFSLVSFCSTTRDCFSLNVISGLDNFRYDMQAAQAPSQAPEPGSLALVLAGLGITSWVLRRRAACRDNSNV